MPVLLLRTHQYCCLTISLVYINLKAFQGKRVFQVFKKNLLSRLNHVTHFQIFCGERRQLCADYAQRVFSSRDKETDTSQVCQVGLRRPIGALAFTSSGPCSFWHLGSCSFVHGSFTRKINCETTTPITPHALEPSERIFWRGVPKPLSNLLVQGPAFLNPEAPVIGRLPRLSAEGATGE